MTECYSSIKGLAMRATRLNSNGEWTTGATASAVSDGFVSIGMSENTESGTEYKKKKANGRYCVNQREKDLTNWIDLEIALCEIDPELVELMTGSRLIVDYDGATVGISKTNADADPFALEVWTETAGIQAKKKWIYWLLFCENGKLNGNPTIQDDALELTISVSTFLNPAWGKGPYDVVAQDNLGTPGPLLVNYTGDEYIYQQLTEIAPPTTTCGYVTQSEVYVAPS